MRPGMPVCEALNPCRRIKTYRLLVGNQGREKEMETAHTVADTIGVPSGSSLQVRSKNQQADQLKGTECPKVPNLG